MSCGGVSRDLLALEADRALARRGQPGDRAQRGRLAGAVGADQRHDLALLHRQRDALERLDVAVVGVDVLDLEQRHQLSRLPAWCRGRPRPRARSRAPPAGTPSAIFSPWSSTVMCSETPMTTFMSCSISRIVRPRSSRSVLHEVASAARTPAGSSPRWARRAAAAWARRPARGRSPPGAGRRRTRLIGELVELGRRRRPTYVEQSRGPSRAPRAPPGAPRAGAGSSRTARPACARAGRPSRSRARVMVANRRMFWNVRAMPSAVILSGRMPGDVLARRRRSAGVGLYRPVSMLKKVVLPAPLGPMIETIERRGIEKSTSLTATRPPKAFDTSVAVSSGGCRGAGAARSRACASKTVLAGARRPRSSSSLRLRSGSRPSGRSTIISTSRKPKIAERELGEVEVQADRVGHAAVEHVGDQVAC